MSQTLYHITTQAAWEHAQQAGIYTAESLAAQGFIHLTTEGQVAKVANALYRGAQDLLLLSIDPALLHANLRFEAPDPAVPAAHTTGERFPHLYGPLNLDAVSAAQPFTCDDDGVFRFPS